MNVGVRYCLPSPKRFARNKEKCSTRVMVVVIVIVLVLILVVVVVVVVLVV